VRYRAATWSSHRFQIRSHLPLLSHLSGALCSVARGCRLGRAENTKEVRCLVAAAGAPNEALSSMPGTDLEPFGAPSGSQSRPPTLQVRALLAVRVTPRSKGSLLTKACRDLSLDPGMRFHTATGFHFASPAPPQHPDFWCATMLESRRNRARHNFNFTLVRGSAEENEYGQPLEITCLGVPLYGQDSAKL
jgi:hypothetical protein